MKKIEYNCFWLDVFNSTSLQEFLDEKGKQGWQLQETIPGKDSSNYQTLFILKREVLEEVETIIL